MRLECFGRENLQVNFRLDLVELLLSSRSWTWGALVWSWWAMVRHMVLVLLTFQLSCRQPLPTIVRAWLAPDSLTPFYTRPKRKETLTFLINVNNFSKGYSRSLWLTRTLPMPPMSTSTAQVISYSESSNSWRVDILKLPSYKNIVSQRTFMVAGKFDEARKHAHSSLQILSRHLPKVVNHSKTFKELP